MGRFFQAYEVAGEKTVEMRRNGILFILAREPVKCLGQEKN